MSYFKATMHHIWFRLQPGAPPQTTTLGERWGSLQRSPTRHGWILKNAKHHRRKIWYCNDLPMYTEIDVPNWTSKCTVRHMYRSFLDMYRCSPGLLYRSGPPYVPSGSRDVSVMWPFHWPWAIFYGYSIDADTLSPVDFKILRLKCIRVTVYWPRLVTLRHRSRDHTFRGMWFPKHVGYSGLLTLSSKWYTVTKIIWLHFPYLNGHTAHFASSTYLESPTPIFAH